MKWMLLAKTERDKIHQYKGFFFSVYHLILTKGVFLPLPTLQSISAQLFLPQQSSPHMPPIYPGHGKRIHRERMRLSLKWGGMQARPRLSAGVLTMGMMTRGHIIAAPGSRLAPPLLSGCQRSRAESNHQRLVSQSKSNGQLSSIYQNLHTHHEKPNQRGHLIPKFCFISRKEKSICF